MIIEYRMKTHSRTKLELRGWLKLCPIHNRYPDVYEIIVGKRKENHWITVCDSDECGKISMKSKEHLINSWNTA